MSQEKQFYVYMHRYASGPKQGEVFYVGKGMGGRAVWKYDRNTYWKRVSAKYGYTVHILTRFHNEECAFSLERALIAFYGRSNLCNMTDGGDGVRGYTFTDEVKRKMSMSMSGEKHHMFGKKHSKESIEKMILSTEKKKVLCSNGMIFDSAKDASKWVTKEFGFINPQGNISSCARGDRRIAYGFTWSYEEE